MSIFHGGSYKRCLELNTESDNDCHHLISKAALTQWYQNMKHNRYTKFLSFKSQSWAPSIVMTHEDHMLTLSYCGDDACDDELLEAAYKYIDSQAERLIKSGDIIGVLKEETSFIEELFGSKYKAAITEMWDYFYTLNPRIEGTVLSFTNPNIHNFTFHYDFSSQ